MRAINAELDESRMIPIPPGRVSAADADEWARERAASIRSAHDLDTARSAAIVAALLATRELRSRSSGEYFLIFDPLSKLVAPLRIVISEGELDAAGQSDFLLPAAPLAPQLRLTPATAFGVGCSSTFPTPRPGFAEIRWLFVASGLTLAATLAPVATAAAMSAAITAEDLLAALRIDGGLLETSNAFDVEALIAQSREGQPEWSL